MAKTLREAVELGDNEGVLRLVKSGHDVNQISDLYKAKPPPSEPYEESLLQLAARLGNVEVVKTLIAAGASLEKENYFQVAAPDVWTRTTALVTGAVQSTLRLPTARFL